MDVNNMIISITPCIDSNIQCPGFMMISHETIFEIEVFELQPRCCWVDKLNHIELMS